MVENAASLIEGLSQRDVVLASETESRRKLLTAAGIAFRIVEPDVDEAAIHEALFKDNEERDPGDVAELLARAKAQEVSARFPGALVIGAEQALSLQREDTPQAGGSQRRPRHSVRAARQDASAPLGGRARRRRASHLDLHRDSPSDDAAVLPTVPRSIPCCRRPSSPSVGRRLSARRARNTALRSY